MGELDYQMALLLQHKFEQEHKSRKTYEKSDEELARVLQEQFTQEVVVEAPSSLVYDNKAKNRSRNEANSSKCLTDPSWELVDPTPDIHILFVAFNKRYFWGTLETVCVSWSKRMTTCAGICSYQGRGGMCNITLSEPLLKLRPRKDLVETLLHEMIHAYLFVTNNNRNRDGHGPEFHKHMFRINKESGTNITVYHSFHDEVRLYQQHWWRCNGPCQHRRPFFGMVRRATNRAPGPNDRWWAEHSNSCGGTFIKVQEPEKKQKPLKGKENGKQKPKSKLPDIRKFLPVKNNDKDIGSNIKGFKDLSTLGTSKVLTPSANSNITGFKDLKSRPTGGRLNSVSTIVETKTKTGTKNDENISPTAFNNPTFVNNKPEVSTEVTDEFLAVRNHWQNKFSNDNKNKRPGLENPLDNPKTKVPKTDDISPAVGYANCPICNKKIVMSELNSHLDDCLNPEKPQKSSVVDLTDSIVEGTRECPLCDVFVPISEFEPHVQDCIQKMASDMDDEAEEVKEEKVPCLACGKEIRKGELTSHLDECMNDIFDRKSGADDNVEKDRETSPDLGESSSGQKFNCPFCLKLISEFEMKTHIDVCLTQVDSDLVKSLVDEF